MDELLDCTPRVPLVCDAWKSPAGAPTLFVAVIGAIDLLDLSDWQDECQEAEARKQLDNVAKWVVSAVVRDDGSRRFERAQLDAVKRLPPNLIANVFEQIAKANHLGEVGVEALEKKSEP